MADEKPKKEIVTFTRNFWYSVTRQGKKNKTQFFAGEKYEVENISGLYDAKERKLSVAFAKYLKFKKVVK